MRNIAEIIKDDKNGKQLSQTERQIAVAYVQGKYDAVRELNLNGDRTVSLNAVLNILNDFSNRPVQTVKGIIAELPPVTPQRPKGHWIMKHRKINEIRYHTGEDILNDEIHTIKELIRYECDEPYCSECGKRAGDTSDNFCCFCGADMR